MELNEMKTLWDEMSTKIDKQKKLTDTLIIKMTTVNYRNTTNRILIPETISSIVCLAAAAIIIFNLHQLNTWYLEVCGVLAILLLFVLPMLSMRSIRSLRSVKITDADYRQVISAYSKAKIKFVSIQKWSFYLSALLFVVTLPVMGKLIGGKDLFIETRIWIWYGVGYVFFYGLSKWVFKGYMKATIAAENVLKELEG